MMGSTHRCFGALAGAGLAAAQGEGRTMIVITALVATATSHGWASPDVDQTRAWRSLGVVPFLRPLLAHRSGLSHWWFLPFVAGWAVAQLPERAQWVGWALLAGWASHLVGDFIFGRLHPLPWGGPGLGLGLRTDGLLENGKVHMFGRKRRAIPVSPAKVVIVAALVWIVWAVPSVTAPPIPPLPSADSEPTTRSREI
ncbi:MAG: metal-dependent hydrolase [Dermatophilaceae bacterium]